jgi:hypothetical protein
MHTPSLERITHKVQADIDAGRMPGAVMLVHKDGKTVFDQALGKRAPTASFASTP